MPAMKPENDVRKPVRYGLAPMGLVALGLFVLPAVGFGSQWLVRMLMELLRWIGGAG